MAKKLTIKVKALADGFYGGIKHFPEWSGEKRAGQPFTIGLDACPKDEAGKVLVLADMTPVMPKWMEAIEPLPKLDPKVTPCAVADETFLRKWTRYGRPTRFGVDWGRKSHPVAEEPQDEDEEEAESVPPAAPETPMASLSASDPSDPNPKKRGRSVNRKVI